ncbi:N-acetyltransferase [Oscillatoriales cyanobacterium LEGE 11467]|uniref:N-acetyltransferase n=1 Tax=Zarconia navalis LEGE 11467 TaxID=1828826 RepID=A0A928Z8S5_9CYAN|nr:GNAT family N-acetyltransferase [Zarconia navalis]MBE9040121.1 N-acetyltransferase [Zarconia navalis LEGE 11467]
MNIRDATLEDLRAIVEIYNATIPGRMATADTEPITFESRLPWYRKHETSALPLWAIEIDGAIAGWLSLEEFYGRPAYRATAEVSIYIAPAYQKQGWGKILLGEAIARGSSFGLSTFVGFIFAHNEPSLRLFEKFGFREWGYLPRVAQLDGVARDLIILGRPIDAD